MPDCTAHQAHNLPELVALGLPALDLPALDLKVDEFCHVWVREDPVATPAADFPEARCLHEAHKVVEAHLALDRRGLVVLEAD
ncbi:MAG: hypothetical protein ACRDSE_24690 [Pseudonocardiaceae bacterium]